MLQAYMAGYVMPNQYKPDLVGAPNSMSPHLRFGCLSIRKFYWELHDIFGKARTYLQEIDESWLLFPMIVHEC